MELLSLTRKLSIALLAILVLPLSSSAQDCSDKSGEEAASCRREQAAARQEAKRGGLDDHNADYQKNALARCQVLSGADRDDCVRRVEGGGASSGSVESGGIYRETRTIVPGTSSPSPNGTSSSPPDRR